MKFVDKLFEIMAEKKKKRRFIFKKRYLIPIGIIVLLIAFRLYLPTLVKNYLNEVLADIPGYYGHVEDVDIALYRGAYVIDGMYLNKMNGKTQVPFLNFPKNDISIEWKSLFKGKIVSEILMTSPEVIYVFEDHKQPVEGKKPDIDDWTEALKDIVPIKINHFEVHDGKVAFVEIQSEPNIDLHIDQLYLTADNLRNVVEKERVLPSPISATGVSVGGGKMTLEGSINLFKEIPDMDLEFSLQNSDVTAYNEFSSKYAGVDFESGVFEVYSEIAIADAYLKGYLKPMFIDTKLISKEDSFLESLWEGFVGLFKFLLKNHGTDTVATQIPIEGDLKAVDAGVWSTILNIFKNAWIQAFKGQVEGSIEYEDAFQEKKNTPKNKK